MSLISLGVLNSQAAGAALASDIEFIETVTIGTAAASITFSQTGGWSDYAYLRIVGNLISNNLTGDNMTVSINGNATDYRQRIGTNAVAITADTTTSLGLQRNDEYHTPFIAEVMQINNSSAPNTVLAFNQQVNLGVHAFMLEQSIAATASSITISGVTYLIDVGSYLTLYGVKAAA